MKLIKYPLLAALLGVAAILTGQAQGFDNGSTGADGALDLTDGNQTIQLPPNGRLNYTSINIPLNRTLRFVKNALNTPVYLLSQGDVIIEGFIDVSGSAGPGNPPIGGQGGPGGFDGGKPGFGNAFPPGDGYGPGAGGAGDNGRGPTSAGGAGYGTPGDQAPINGTSQFNGQTYGSALLMPLIGGSGGGGTSGLPGIGGGGGGGAVLVASNTKIRIGSQGLINASGGSFGNTAGNAGSGGAIRLLAPRVEGTGRAIVDGGAFGGGAGRVRLDLLDKTALQLRFQPGTFVATVGTSMFVEPDVIPRLDVTAAAGQAIPDGTGSTVRILLPFGSDTNRTITLRAKDFNADVPIRVTLTPDSGSRIVIDTNIVNTTVNPATLTVPFGLPPNTLVTIQAWTR